MAAERESTFTHFGRRRVRTADKDALVRGVFDGVAERYDLMNDLMSLGIHRRWKRAMVDWLNPRPGMHAVDVAGGTGDIAFRILERTSTMAAGAPARVSVVDTNQTMLQVGRDRALNRGLVSGIGWLCGNAESLPLASGAADAVTIAFGIRNVTRLEAALSEARRVLKPGGRFLCLEFSHTVLPGLDRLYDAWSFAVLPAIGAAVTGRADAYEYLVESIRRFPDQQTFAALVTGAGLGNVKWRNLTGGIVALHSAWRL